MKSILVLLGIAILATSVRGQDAEEPATAFTEEEPAFGFWVSIVECKEPNAKPIFSFNKVMRCGCAVGTKYSGPCYDLGQEVLGLSKGDVERLAKEMQTKSPAPTPVEQCQTVPRSFLDSGTGDSGANFDELYDAAMNSACNQEELEWRARDCRDSFIPGMGAEGFTEVQDRSVPYCTIECETLFLNISTNCPRVYELLNLGQFSDLCPALKTVAIPARPVGVAPAAVDSLPPVVVPETQPVVPTPEVAVPPVVDTVAPSPEVTVVEPPVVVAVAPEPPVVAAVAPEPQASSAVSRLGVVGLLALVLV